MLVPLSWLKEYVEIDEDIERLEELFIMTGSKVESIKKPGENIKNVVVGKVLEIENHPNADRLRVAKVDVGDQILTIVTGATNVKRGDYVPVAKVGAVLAGGLLINKTTFRGIESEGMMCSAEELGMDEDLLSPEKREGILILPELPLGDDVKKYLGLDDYIIEFEITTNRPDCLSIIGMAREAAAIFGRNVKYPEIKVSEKAKENIEDVLKIRIEDSDLCPRYAARVVKNVKIEESPLWIQKKLMACGVRPINNIVDITNYVMLEMGQPLHAFDYEKIAGNTIVVRRAKDGEKITTLDGRERVLSPDMLVIADIEKPSAIAGVMGGEYSEITEKTRTIIIESANFYGSSIRSTSKKLGLRTEASSRFEKGIDINLVPVALDRAAQLIEELGYGEVVKGVLDISYKKVEPREIAVRPEKINALLGTSLNISDMRSFLDRIDIKTRGENGKIYAIIPTYRMDITMEADIAEEIARFYGYDNIPETTIKNTELGYKTQEQNFEDMVKNYLIALGYYEVSTYSFYSPKVFDKLNLKEQNPLRNAVRILNPLGEDYSIMRTTLIPSVLDVLKTNISRGIMDVKIFEFGRRYFKEGDEYKETKTVALAISKPDSDFYDLKGDIEAVTGKLGIKDLDFIREEVEYLHPGRSAGLYADGRKLGIMGEIHPEVLENYEIEKRIYVAEINFEAVFEVSNLEKVYTPLPKYPAIERDIAVVVNDEIPSKEVQVLIRNTGGELLEEVMLFDIYKGVQIPEDKKSLAFTIRFRSKERTLTDDEVNNIMERIIKTLEEKLGARLR